MTSDTPPAFGRFRQRPGTSGAPGDIQFGGMRLGLVPPVVNRNPRFDPADWEVEAGGEEIAAASVAAEQAGFDFVCFPGHVAIPEAVAEVRGGVYWDPVATMSYVAARTERIRLAAYCVVLGYFHPLQIA